MAVGEPVGTRRGRIGWGRALGGGGRRRGRNGSRFVVLRVQSTVVDFELGVVGLGRTFNVHERHRARHRDLARLLLGHPWQ